MNPCLSGLNGWRESILKEFVRWVSKLILVADPDGLLTEGKLAFRLQERGFDLIEFNDPVEFRFTYESRYRTVWDSGEETNVVVLRLQDSELASLPYDLLEAGLMLSFNLGNLFPNLSCPVVEKLDRSLLDTLFEAQQKSSPDRMGDTEIFRLVQFHLTQLFSYILSLFSCRFKIFRGMDRLQHVRHCTSLPVRGHREYVPVEMDHASLPFRFGVNFT